MINCHLAFLITIHTQIHFGRIIILLISDYIFKKKSISHLKAMSDLSLLLQTLPSSELVIYVPNLIASQDYVPLLR